MRRTLGEQLRDAQKIKRLERIDLLLKIVCLTLIGGYILSIIKTINQKQLLQSLKKNLVIQVSKFMEKITAQLLIEFR